MAEGQVYIVNIQFDGGDYGEYVRMDPTLMQDWIDAMFVTPVDERGERIVRGDTLDGSAPVVYAPPQ